MNFSSKDTVRKTLLNFGIDPKSKADLKELLEALGKIDSETKAIGKSLRNSLKNLEPGGLSGSLKNEVSLQRKQLADAQQTSRTLLNQIAQSLAPGLSRQQQAQLSKSFDTIMNDITGRVSASAVKAAKRSTNTLYDYYNREFAQQPQIKRFSQLKQENIASLSQTDLRNQLASNRLYLKGANQALRDRLETGDKKSIEAAQRTVIRLSEATTSAAARLKELESAAKKVTKAEEKRARDAENARQKELKRLREPSAEQKRVNRAVERIQQNDTNRRIDNGASQFKNQATLLRNYAVLGGGIGAGVTSANFIVDLDRQFKQLQSIVALTNEEMDQLSTQLIDISEKTKFTATEVTDAAIVLGQAGLGKNDIQNALEGVTLFATAVGSDLKSAVDLATSTLGVFNKDSSQMVDIVDKMTTAVNSSKLNLDKLALGLQYSGNLAAQSNITFEETVSALGAMANSGIRAGSTLGTGLRQIIIALQKPSEAFKNKIHDLDLSLSDVDISTHGLIKVLRTLAQAGFTVRDAMETMQVRAASAYGAFANNIDVADDLNKRMQIGGSAARANSIQMESLGNQMARLGSISKSIVYESMEPLLKMITKLTEKTADFLSTLRSVSGLLSTLAVPAGILVAALSARSVLKLGGSLLGGAGALASGKGLGAAAATAARGVPFTGALRLLGLSNPYVLGATVLGSAATAGYQYLDTKARSQDRVDLTQAQVNENAADISQYDAQLKKVNNSISTLILKQNTLKGTALSEEIRKLNSEFKQQGLYIDSSVDSYDKLLEKMRDFRESTDNAAAYLKSESRQGLQANSEALLSDLFASTLFEDNARTVARQGFYGGGGRIFSNQDAMFLFRLLREADPSFVNRLDQNNQSIKNIQLGSPGTLDQLSAAQSSTQGLARELVALVNTDPKKLQTLFGDANLKDPELQQRVTEFVNDLAAQLFDQANTLLQVQTNEEKFVSRDPAKLKAQQDLARQVQSNFVESMLQTAADIQEELSAVNVLNEDEATKDYLGTYNKIRTIYDERLKGLKVLEDEALSFLESKGVGAEGSAGRGARKQYLQRAGFYKNLGLAEGRLSNSLRTSAEEAKTDAEVRYQAEISAIEEQLRGQRDLLRQVTNEKDSQLILAKANELVSLLETTKAKRDLFASDLNGISNPSVEARNRTTAVLVEEGQNENNRLNSGALNRSRIAGLLSARASLGLAETRLNDDDLHKLISDFVAEQQKRVNNQLTAVRQQAGDLRYQAGVNNELASEYAGISQDASLTREARLAALQQSENYRSQAESLEQQANALETEGVERAKSALAELAEYLKNEIVNNPELSPGRSKLKAANSVEGLTATQAQFDNSLTELTQANERLKTASEDAAREVKVLGKSISESPFNRGEFAKVRSLLYGTTNTNTASGYDDTSTQSDSNSLTDRLGAGMDYIGSELKVAYDGYDGLTDMVLRATDLTKGFGDQMGATLSDIFKGVADADDAFKAMFASIFSNLADMASQALSQQIVSIGASFLPGGTSAGAAFTGKHVLAGGFYTGGRYIGAGNPNRDSVYAKVSKGEFILRRRAVEALGVDTVRALNSADPNIIKSNEVSASSPVRGTASDPEIKLNIWVVSKDEVPASEDRSNAVVDVADNIQRGGTLKQLIRSIVLKD